MNHRTVRTPYSGATRGRKKGVAQPRPSSLLVEATPAQVEFIRQAYGKGHLVPTLARELNMPRNAVDAAVRKLRRVGLLPPGAGQGWPRVLAPRPGAVSTPIPSQPFCPDGSAHHRLCGPLIEKDMPRYYDTHPRAPYGCELQVCRLCGDRLIIRLSWARGEDVEVCEVA